MAEEKTTLSIPTVSHSKPISKEELSAFNPFDVCVYTTRMCHNFDKFTHTTQTYTHKNTQLKANTHKHTQTHTNTHKYT